ncbi:hypothetical protein J8N05_35075 [Streptomyces sp. BH-SS-21]|uniref:Uncharacterized protein n=1 Tax=Streptomyces liliiviolaceus TaxID=2823109 RepID=A0A941BA31_9ACTN|nr:hypothetical protein [Streptomyces liliiviolaceus]MBQ0853391.1 hypothetical protein [Streptomyces liliiviolaceus]
MTDSSQRAAGWYLIIVALAADILSILGFAGFKANFLAGILLVGFLSAAGIVASGITLVKSSRLWLSPRGSYYPPTYHVRQVFVGAASLVVSVVLAVAFITVIIDSKDGGKKQDKTHVGNALLMPSPDFGDPGSRELTYSQG